MRTNHILMKLVVFYCRGQQIFSIQSQMVSVAAACLHYTMNTATDDYGKEGVWLCSNKRLFTKVAIGQGLRGGICWPLFHGFDQLTVEKGSHKDAILRAPQLYSKMCLGPRMFPYKEVKSPHTCDRHIFLVGNLSVPNLFCKSCVTRQPVNPTVVSLSSGEGMGSSVYKPKQLCVDHFPTIRVSGKNPLAMRESCSLLKVISFCLFVGIKHCSFQRLCHVS